jgi:cation diffusion facilitator family transporter
MASLSIATSIATLALKFGAWHMTGSISLLSDAMETFVNVAAGFIALAVLTIAERPADARHNYGYEKAEYFSSGVEGGLILFAGFGILYAAAGRLVTPAPLEALGPGLAVAAVAAALNFVTATLMHRVARQHDSIVVEADAHHLMTDVLASVVVIAGLLLVMAVPRFAILDAVLAIGVGIQILRTAVSLLRRSVEGLMDTALPPAEVDIVHRVVVSALPPGASLSRLLTRKSGSRRFIELRLQLPGAITVDEAGRLCDRVEAAVHSGLAKSVVSIRIEPH